MWGQQYDPASLARWDPTPLKIVRGMLELAKVSSQDIVYDLGSGDGRILFMAVEEFGAQKAIGYEIRQDLYDDCWKEIRRRNLQKRISVIRGNLLDADISEASVITLYLFPTANEILKPKLEKEIGHGIRVISHDYPIETWQIDKREVCAGGKLYMYITPQAFQVTALNNTKNDEQCRQKGLQNFTKPDISISLEEAFKLCQMYIGKHKARLFSQCWGCLKFSKNNPEKMCFYKPPDNNGCRFVNKEYGNQIT
jgi:hypothetical protein